MINPANIFGQRLTPNVPGIQSPSMQAMPAQNNIFGARMGVPTNIPAPNIPMAQAPAAITGGGLPPMQGYPAQPIPARPTIAGIQAPILQRPPVNLGIQPQMGNIFRARMGMRY